MKIVFDPVAVADIEPPYIVQYFILHIASSKFWDASTPETNTMNHLMQRYPYKTRVSSLTDIAALNTTTRKK